MHDVTPDWLGRLREFVDAMPGRIDDYESLLTGNTIWLQRTQGVGKISGDDAIAYGMTGPALRAAGVEHDVRKARPYSGYENYEFEIPVGTEGDIYDRYLVRMEEMRQSCRILDQALAQPARRSGQHRRSEDLPPAQEARAAGHGGADPPVHDRHRGLRVSGRRGLPLDRGAQGRAGFLHRLHRRDARRTGCASAPRASTTSRRCRTSSRAV